jgi:hypothetical protein
MGADIPCVTSNKYVLPHGAHRNLKY